MARIDTSKRNRNAGKHPSYKGRSKESIKKKRAADKAYNATPAAKKHRADSNRKRREQQKKGNPKARVGSKFDYDHATGRMEARSKNRGRKGEGNRVKKKKVN